MRLRIKCNASHRHGQRGSLTAQTARRTAGQMRCRRWQSNTSMHTIEPKWLRRVLFEKEFKKHFTEWPYNSSTGRKVGAVRAGHLPGSGGKQPQIGNCRSSLRNRKIVGTPALAERSDHPGSGDGRDLRFGQPRGARETGLRPKSSVSGCAPGGPGVRPESRGPRGAVRYVGGLCMGPGDNRKWCPFFVRRWRLSDSHAHRDNMDCLESVHVFALGT